jgi:hypothetical protein
MVMAGAQTGLQHGTLVMPSSERSLPAVAGFNRNEFTRPGRRGDRGGLETFFHKIVMIRNNLPLLEQKVNANEPPSPRLRRAKQTERSGQVRAATVHHALLRIAHHVQHPVQK